MFMSGNPGWDADRYYGMLEAQHKGWLETRPICKVCGNPIEDDFAYHISDDPDDWVCDECISELRERIPD